MRLSFVLFRLHLFTSRVSFILQDTSVDDPATAAVIGMRRKQIAFTSMKDLKEQTDFVHRLPLDQWWMNLRPLNRILAKHETVYKSEVILNETGTVTAIPEETNDSLLNEK